MTDNANASQSAPFSHPLAAADVPEQGVDVVVRASSEECAALAKLNDLVALSLLEAEIEVRRDGKGGLAVTGELRANMRRTCVVTLDEFDVSVIEPLGIKFAPPAEARALEDKIGYVDSALEDPPDPLIDGRVDLGSIVAEFLALALDPYPRKPGASFVAPETRAESEPVSPFAKLQSGRTIK